MKIQDYLHMYLGCDVQSVKNGRALDGKLTGVGFDDCVIKDNRTLQSEVNEIEAVYPILRLLSDMTEEEMFAVAKLQGYELNKVIVTDDDEPITNRLLEARFFHAGEPDPQGVFDPIELDCIGFKTQVLHGVKEGIGEIWSEPAWDTFWNWESDLNRRTWLYLLSKYFDVFDLIKAGLAVYKTKSF